MEQIVFLVVIASAVIQASWNFLAKKFPGNKTAAICIGWFFLGAVFVPVSARLSDLSRIDGGSLILIFASALIHSTYVGFLGWAYSVGDISVVYPIARGLGIAGTTALTFGLGFEALSAGGVLGIAVVVCGSLLIASAEVYTKRNGKGLLLSAIIGALISLSALVDKAAVRAVPPFFLISILGLLMPLLLSPLFFTKYRKETMMVLKNHKRDALLIGFGGAFSYVLILWAYQSTPAAYVVALREISVVFASALGVVLLKEPFSIRKAFGVVSIFAGAVLLRLGG